MLCQLSHSHCVLTSFLSVFSISVNHCCSFILRVPFNLLCSFSVIVTVLSFFNYIFIKSFSLSHFASIPSLLFISSTPLSLKYVPLHIFRLCSFFLSLHIFNMSLSICSVSLFSFSFFHYIFNTSFSLSVLSFYLSLSLSLYFIFNISLFLSLSLRVSPSVKHNPAPTCVALHSVPHHFIEFFHLKRRFD